MGVKAVQEQTISSSWILLLPNVQVILKFVADIQIMMSMTLPSDLQPKDQLPKHHQKSQLQLLQSPLTQITASEQVAPTVKDVEDITKEESVFESKILTNLQEVPSLGNGLTCALSYNFRKLEEERSICMLVELLLLHLESFLRQLML